MFSNAIDALNKYTLICGVDEAGRGPLAGPVFAACVILYPDCKINGLDDSKKMTAKKRDYMAKVIKESAMAWTVASASAEEIDELNILQASLLAMKRAIVMLSVSPEIILIDGNQCPRLDRPMRTVVKGDSLIPAISAASILAKTARDAEMLSVHSRFPAYGFDQHKGYPTKKHLEALRFHGVSAIHRRSFAPVKVLIK